MKNSEFIFSYTLCPYVPFYFQATLLIRDWWPIFIFYCVKCGFCKKLLKYFFTNATLTSYQLFSFCHHFWVCLLLLCCLHPPISDDEMKKKWATGQSCIRKKVTSYKIHTLVVALVQYVFTSVAHFSNIPFYSKFSLLINF